jgi:hypothetical protein
MMSLGAYVMDIDQETLMTTRFTRFVPRYRHL